MDQKKIGEFISVLRKERGMTQQQLADAIGVSNKTISKWECGKGMPELALMLPLCDVLQINMNELLTGEHLSESSYPEQAEANMRTLIQETESRKKKKHSSLLLFGVAIAMFFCVIFYIFIFNMGISMNMFFMDVPTLLCMFVVTILFLLVTNLGHDFFYAFMFVLGKKETESRVELFRAKSAIKLAGITFLAMGLIESCIAFMSIRPMGELELLFRGLSISVSIALNGILYGLIGYLLLLPMRIRLEVLCVEREV